VPVVESSHQLFGHHVTTLLRFYQRILLTFVIFYTIVLNAPFLRGIIAWLVCMAILALDFV
jgi:hypothetical protein